MLKMTLIGILFLLVAGSLVAEVRDKTRSVPVVPVVGKVVVGKNLFQIPQFTSDGNIPPMLSRNHDAFNPLNPELNPICYLLALLGAHHFLHVSRIRVKSLNFRRLMSYIYGAPILDVSRSHTTTQHSR